MDYEGGTAGPSLLIKTWNWAEILKELVNLSKSRENTFDLSQLEVDFLM